MTAYGAGGSIRSTTAPMRILLRVAAGLVLLVGIPLYLFPDRTATLFAWTIDPPLTALFLGGSYWASFLTQLLAARRAVWVEARAAVPAVVVFTVLTAVATLIHRDRFHFDAPNWWTVAGTWIWLAIYLLVPAALLVALVRQRRAAGADPPRRTPMTPAWRAATAALAVVLAAIGAALFVVPDDAQRLWPWALTPLTARAVGAWLIGLGVGAGMGWWEADWERVRPITAPAVVFVVLQTIALVRARSTLDWSSADAWGYAAVLVALAVVGGWGWRAARAQKIAE